MPRCRTRIEPAFTDWPSPTLTPSRWPTLSRLFFELEPAFLCAMSVAYVSFLARGARGGFSVDLGSAGGSASAAALPRFGASAAALGSALADLPRPLVGFSG